jgi:Putative adhesin
MKLFSRPFLLAGAVLAGAACGGIDLSTSAQTRPQGRFERTLTVSGPVDLSVRTGSGDVDIRIGSGDRVQVVGRITAGRRLLDNATERIRQIETSPPIQQTGNTIRIGDTNDDPRYRDVSISYELIVPATTQINSQTGSGNQRIGRVNGAVRARTGSGNIDVEGTGDALDAQTGSGNIQVNAVSGAIKAQTGSGNIEVAQIRKADVEAQTGSGNVRLSLPADAAFTLTARTGSGSIDTTHPVQVEGRRRRNRLDGVVRGGGNRVDITTGSGSIDIR